MLLFMVYANYYFLCAWCAHWIEDNIPDLTKGNNHYETISKKGKHVDKDTTHPVTCCSAMPGILLDILAMRDHV